MVSRQIKISSLFFQLYRHVLCIIARLNFAFSCTILHIFISIIMNRVCLIQVILKYKCSVLKVLLLLLLLIVCVKYPSLASPFYHTVPP